MLLYIDPGTGSMLFTILIGAITALYFFLRKLVVYMKFRLSGGRVGTMDSSRIPFVIFSDNKQYWTVFKPICDEFEKRRTKVVYWTASDQDPALQCSYKYVDCQFIGEGNRAFAKLNMMNACICLATTPGLDVLQWKRSKNVDWYVHILHAAGTSAAGYRMFSLDYYDAVLLTGDFQVDEIRELERKRNLPAKELKILGCTYMDAMWERVQGENKTEEPGAKSEKEMTVLLAPSWGPGSILCRYGERIIEPLVEAGYRLIIRPHPQSFVSDKKIMDELQARYPDSERLRWNSDPDNFDCLNSADIMISDFSSVIFDFTLIFNKPVIYAENVFVKDAYDAAWLDEEMWKFRILPSIGLPLREEDFPNMKQIIADAVADQSLSAGRQKARSEAWAHIGESASLTVDYLTEKYEELNNRKQENNSPKK